MTKTAPTIIIRRESDEWIIEIKTMVMNQNIKFKLDQPYDDSFPMGGGSFKVGLMTGFTEEITLNHGSTFLDHTQSHGRK